nr:hypothetical protein [Tanacetum cinerariifolium]
QIETTIPAATSVPACPKSNSSGQRRNRKACFYATLPHSKPQKHRVPTVVLTQSKPVSNTVVRLVSAALPNISAPVVSAAQGKQGIWGNPQQALKDKGVIDSGCSRHMTGNISYLSEFEELNGGYVAFGGNPKGGKITVKVKLRQDKGVIDSGCSRHMTRNISYLSEFEELNGGYVAFGGNPKGGKITVKVKLRQNIVLFTDIECLVLSPDFKLLDEN